MSASLTRTRPAGVSSEHDDGAVRQALQDPDRPPTPPHVHRFRDMRIEHEPGVPVRCTPLAFRHPGAAMDPLPPPNTVYGRRMPKDAATAAEVLWGAPQSRLDAWRQHQAESIYSSTQQRPLGRSPLPHGGAAADLAASGSGAPAADGASAYLGAVAMAPDACAQQRRGRQLADGRGVREALAPHTRDGSNTIAGKEPGAIHRQYVTSHHDYWPGEQLNRSYDWGGLDPRSHAFGAAPAATPRDGSAVQGLLSGAACSVGPCTAPLDAATQVGRRRSSSFSSTSEPVTAGSGGPSYGWGDGGSGYTTGAAAAAAASGGRKQLHNRQGGSGYTTGAAAVAAAAGSGRREQLYSKPAPGEAEHRTCSSRALPRDHVFGVPSHGRAPQEGAGALIHSQAPALPLSQARQGHGQAAASAAPANRQAAGVPSRPQQCRLGAEDVSADRGGGTDICGRPLNRARDPVIGEVLFPSAPRSVLSGPEAELPRSRDELWDLVGVPLRLTPAELDTIVSVAAGGGGGARSGFASVADCMRARQALRPAAGAHIIS